MNSISKELAKKAKQNGICKDWYNELKQINDTEKFLDMYLKGIDFCLANNYPSNDFIRAHFQGKMELRGVHLDEPILINNEHYVVALGKCTGKVFSYDFNVSEIFLKHESELTVIATDHSFVMIDIFDNAKLKVMAHDNAKVCVNRYGGKVEFESFNGSIVKIKEKNQKTY